MIHAYRLLLFVLLIAAALSSPRQRLTASAPAKPYVEFTSLEIVSLDKDTWQVRANVHFLTNDPLESAGVTCWDKYTNGTMPCYVANLTPKKFSYEPPYDLIGVGVVVQFRLEISKSSLIGQDITNDWPLWVEASLQMENLTYGDWAWKP